MQKEEKAELILDYEDYAPHLKDEIIYHLYALCKVENTNYEYFAQDDFRITFPSITIELKEEPVTNQILYGSAFFKNPLPEKLRNCVFLIEGPGLIKGLKYKIDDVQPNETAKVNFKMIPRHYGKQTIIAKFNSLNLTDIDGYVIIHVEKGDEIGCNSEPSY
uniref:Transglut_C domain-containing protein n=1 Tax=Rhodnius prolixus TaxID=13249 RepID=T1HLR0_RHOPR